MENQKGVLAILLINLFIAFLGIGLVIPVLPTIMNELNISGSVVGYMVAAFAITQLIFSPLAGKWVDKFGRKIMIVIGLFVFGFRSFYSEWVKQLRSYLFLVCLVELVPHLSCQQ